MKTLYKLFNTLALTAIAVVASAQTLSVQGIEAKTGEQKMLTVSLSGAASATALQFNLSLPANMTINEGGCALGNAATNHTLSVNKMNNGDYLFVMYSMDFTALVDGTLLTIPVTIGNDAATGNGNLNTVRSAKSDAVSHQHENVSFTINVAQEAEIQLATGKTMTGYSYDKTLDFSGVTNGKAWIASGFVDGSKVMLSRVNIVPANTGFIVSTETPGDKVIVPVGTGRAYYANLLVPILEEQTIYPTQTIDGVNYTFMGIGTIAATGKTGFVKIASSRQYGPNKCLLKVPTEYLASEARGASELEMVFDDANSIHNSQFTIHNWAGAVYDLQGRRVNYNNRETITNKRSCVPAVASERLRVGDQRSGMQSSSATFNVQRSTLKPGLYIQNGRKVVIK